MKWLASVAKTISTHETIRFIDASSSPVWRTVNYTVNSLNPNALPSADAIIASFFSGNLSEAALHDNLLYHGLDLYASPVYRAYTLDDKLRLTIGPWLLNRTNEPKEALAYASTWKIPFSTIVDMYNRGLISLPLAEHWVERLGVPQKIHRDAMLQLSQLIPPPSDLVRMQVREAFNEQQVIALGLDAEYDESPDYVFWAARQGLTTTTVPDGKGGMRSYDFAKGYWRAHWQLPSPTQAFEMLHRLRPFGKWDPVNRVVLPEPRNPNNVVVTEIDVSALLKAEDYPPLWRDRLSEISYRVIGRIDIRRLYQLGIVPRDEVVEMFEDHGYNRADAEKLTELTVAQADTTALKAARRMAREKIKDAYKLGILNADDAARLLKDHGLTDQQSKAVILLFDSEIQIEYVKSMVKTVRSKVYGGIISLAEAENQLRTTGMQPAGINHQIRLWQSDLSGPRRTLQMSKICDLHSRGIITYQDGVSRLVNLGYSQNDADLAMRSCNQSLVERQMRAAEKSARTAKQADREKERILKENERQRRQMIRDMLAHSSPSSMARWLQKGIISQTEVANRLRRADWPQDDIDRFISDALTPKPKQPTP